MIALVDNDPQGMETLPASADYQIAGAHGSFPRPELTIEPHVEIPLPRGG